MRELGGPRCPRCGVPMHFSVQIASPGRQQAALLFYRCDSCKCMSTETRARSATSPERELTAFDHEFNR